MNLCSQVTAFLAKKKRWSASYLMSVLKCLYLTEICQLILFPFSNCIYQFTFRTNAGGVNATPDVHSFALTKKDHFIILGCDGLWGVCSFLPLICTNYYFWIAYQLIMLSMTYVLCCIPRYLEQVTLLNLFGSS